MREVEKKSACTHIYTGHKISLPTSPGMKVSPPHPAQTLGAHFCPDFLPVGPSCCHCTSRRGSIKPVSHPNLSFLRIGRRKRRQKPAAGLKLLHNIVALAYTVLPTRLNLPLRALRAQQELPEGNSTTIMI